MSLKYVFEDGGDVSREKVCRVAVSGGQEGVSLGDFAGLVFSLLGYVNAVDGLSFFSHPLADAFDVVVVDGWV